MKSTAVAPANIAFIKYWGRQNRELRLPTNSSISMNLSGAYTTTTVEFSPAHNHDEVDVVGSQFSQKEKDRIIQHVDYLRALNKVNLRAKIMTQNNFPKGTGIASSASGFAALTVAAAAALEMKASQKELTILARLGSGSASRSIPDGFVKWEAAKNSEDSFSHSLYPSSYWNICDILVILEDAPKDVSSSKGQDDVRSSPLFEKRLAAVPQRIIRLEEALKQKNFTQFGETLEEDCLDMHAVCQSQVPPILYWTDKTIEVMGAVRSWRNEGLPVYFTIDAGPNVHLICEEKDRESVINRIKVLGGIKNVIVNVPAQGAHLIEKHLF
jgi:diphosphomevalonate decarboxylase